MLRFLAIINLLLITNHSLAQDSLKWSLSPDTLVAAKQNCNCDSIGFKVQILEGSARVALHKSHPEKSLINCSYSYESLYMASSERKIRLLRDLMKFLKDTSICCVKVKPYAMGLNDSLHRLSSTRYSVQIDVLYHINFICFGPYASYYSPFPVLYDNRSGTEINSDLIKVREVCDIYRRWLERSFRSGFKNYQFPLLGTPYSWIFGATKKKILKHLPEVSQEVSNRLGKPKTFN